MPGSLFRMLMIYIAVPIFILIVAMSAMILDAHWYRKNTEMCALDNMRGISRNDGYYCVDQHGDVFLPRRKP